MKSSRWSAHIFQWRWSHSLGSLVICAAAAFICMLIGPDGFSSPADLLAPQSQSILELRLSRVLLGLTVGAALAATGAALQTILRNPLADPYIIGVSGGAALGGAIALCFSSLSVFLTTGSLLGALGSMFLMLSLSRRTDHPDGLLLLGIVFNAFAAALITFLKVLVTPQEVQQLILWLVGTIDYPEPNILFVSCTIVAGLILALFFKRGEIHLLLMGDEEALRLGVNPQRLRSRVYFICCLLVGLLVPLVGMIGFVGLIIPHMVRMVLGPDFRNILPASVFLGMLFLMGCDALVRWSFVWSHTELPVGALTALVGAPAFAWILTKRYRGNP